MWVSTNFCLAPFQDGQESEIIVVDRDVPTTSVSSPLTAAGGGDSLPATSSSGGRGSSSASPPGGSGSGPAAAAEAPPGRSGSGPGSRGAPSPSSSPFLLMDHRFRLPAGDDMKCHVCNVSFACASKF